MFLKVTFTDGGTDTAHLTADSALHVVGPGGVEKAWSLATLAGLELVADALPAPAVVQPEPEPAVEPASAEEPAAEPEAAAESPTQ